MPIFSLIQASQSAARTIDKSPAIHRWEERNSPKSVKRTTDRVDI
jgi:hypothetical protein